MKRQLPLLSLLITLSLCVAVGAASAGIPPEVAEQHESATMLDENEDFVGSFILTSDTVIEKLNGKRRHEETMVISVTRSQDGAIDRRLVRMVEDGRDVTKRRRRSIDRMLAKDLDKDDDEIDGEDLITPFGETADKYNVDSPRLDGDAVLVSFEPKPEYRDEEGMAEGEISWHQETLDPLWIEMTALTAPRPAQELSLRMEFAREGDAVYLTRLVTDGVAKLLLITRRFEIDVRITQVEISSSEAPAEQ